MKYFDLGDANRDSSAQFRKFNRKIQTQTDLAIVHKPGTCCDGVTGKAKAWGSGALKVRREGKSVIALAGAMESTFEGAKPLRKLWNDDKGINRSYTTSEVDLGSFGLSYKFIGLNTAPIKVIKDSEGTMKIDAPAIKDKDAGNEFHFRFLTQLDMAARIYEDGSVWGLSRKGRWIRSEGEPLEHHLEFSTFGTKDGRRAPCNLMFRLDGESAIANIHTCHGLIAVLSWFIPPSKPTDRDAGQEKRPFEGGEDVPWSVGLPKIIDLGLDP